MHSGHTTASGWLVLPKECSIGKSFDGAVQYSLERTSRTFLNLDCVLAGSGTALDQTN